MTKSELIKKIGIEMAIIKQCIDEAYERMMEYEEKKEMKLKKVAELQHKLLIQRYLEADRIAVGILGLNQKKLSNEITNIISKTKKQNELKMVQ